MDNPFSPEQKAELRTLLGNPLIQQALQHALSCAWDASGSPSTLEGAAMAFKQMEGAQTAITTLYKLGDLKKSFSISSPRLKHDAYTV